MVGLLSWSECVRGVFICAEEWHLVGVNVGELAFDLDVDFCYWKIWL